MGEKMGDAFKCIVLEIGCKQQNDAFTSCCKKFRYGEKCGKECIKQKGLLDSCMKKMLKTLENKCPNQLHSYAKCIDDHPNGLEFCHRDKEKFESACYLSKR